MKSFLSVFAVTIFLSINCFAQNLTSSEVNKLRNELETEKINLLKEKTLLLEEIQKLKNKSSEIDIAIEEAIKNNKTTALIKKYGKKDGQNLALGRVWKGMTIDMMLDIWGEPDKKNTNKYSYGVFTQLYYGKITYFFRDGKLFEWEETE